VRPQQASVLACVVLAGTSERLAGLRVLCELIVGVVALSDPVGSILLEILHSVKGGDVFIYLACLYYLPLYMLDIYCA